MSNIFLKLPKMSTKKAKIQFTLYTFVCPFVVPTIRSHLSSLKKKNWNYETNDQVPGGPIKHLILRNCIMDRL